MIQTMGREVVAWISWPAIAWILRVLVGSTFLLAGFTKLPRRRSFEHIVLSFEVLPRAMARIYAKTLPWIEVIIGAALLFGVFSLPTAIFAAAIMTSFILAVIIELLRGKRKIDCGCFGARKQSVAWRILLRNILLLVAILIITVYAAESRPLIAEMHQHHFVLLLVLFLLSAGMVSLVALAIALMSLMRFLLPVRVGK